MDCVQVSPRRIRVPRHGWQFHAAQAMDDCFFKHRVVPRLTDTQQAMVRSQSGPLASAPFTSLPTSPLTLKFSAFCCFAASGALSCCPLLPAGVAVHLMTLANTGQRVRRRECWAGEALHWRVLQRASAGKLGVGSHSTCGSVILTCLFGVPMTRDVLRSLQTDCRFAMAHNWPSDTNGSNEG